MRAKFREIHIDRALSQVYLGRGHLISARMALASTSPTATAHPPVRRISARLVVVFMLAIALVSIPVMPLRFLGLPSWQNIGTRLADGCGSALNGLLGLVSPTNRQASLTPSKEQPTTEESPKDELASLDSAAQQLVTSIEKDPGNPALHNQLGLIYAELGDSDKAVLHFQRAIEVARGKLLALNARERASQMEGGDKGGSVSLVLESSKLSADLSAAHSSLARIYDQLGQHDRVVSELDLLNHEIVFGSSLTPKFNEPAKIVSPPPVLSSVHRLSPACMQLLAKAQALTQARRTTEAMPLYRQVVQLDPQAGIAHQQLGLAAAATGNYWLASQELGTASQIDPNNATTHAQLGSTYQAIGQSEKAINEFQKAIALDPKNVTALFSLGNILATQRQHALAIQVYQRALLINPQSAAIHNNLGSSYSQTGDYKDAIDEFNRALALSPDMASSHYGMGIALYNVKDYRGAISELKRALSLNPGYGDAREKIELAYRKTNGTMGGVPVN
jgi:tetratricopeptide (TPR) repeat protein